MPTEENQNVQTWWNPSTGDQSGTDNAVNNNIDIDLNLDGLDIPVEAKAVEEIPVVEKIQEAVVDNWDDRLAEEDKKVEELQQEKIEEQNVEPIPVVEDIIQEEKADDTVESLIEVTEEAKVEPIVEETIKEPVIEEVKENIELEELDIPEVVQESEIQEEQKIEEEKIETSVVEEIKVEDEQVEELEELVPISEEVEEKSEPVVKNLVVEEPVVEWQLDLDNLDFGSTEEEATVTNEIKEEKNTKEIISDTGDVSSKKDAYVPNEHDFGDVTDALNNVDSGWAIDLWSLETNVDTDKNLEVWVEPEVKSEWWLDLDSMISDLWNTDGLNAEKTIVESVIEPVVETVMEEVKTPEVAVTSEVTQDPQINLGSTAEVVNSATTIPAQAVVMSEAPHKKSSHTWLKIFLFIIILFVWWVFMLSKMYPEEFGDVMSAIQWEDTTVIEYSDNADSGVVLEETQNLDVELTWDIEEVEELDPNSLAWQLEWEVVSGDISNNLEYTWGNIDTDVILDESWHNADVTEEDEFNAFEWLEDVMETVTSENANLLAELRKYQAKWKEYDAWGRAIGNTTAMKYGLYISEKAESVINDIETNVKIDNTKVENYFAQFDIYIAKLDKLRVSIDGEVQDDALVSSWTDESNTEPTTGTVQ